MTGVQTCALPIWRLEALHPALISPQDVHPYEHVRYRQEQRWPAFDVAEASGRDAAWLYAALVDRGDLIRVEQPPQSGSLETREVTDVARPDGLHVEITTAGSAGALSTQVYPGRENVEVLIPPHHPAEDGLDASRLFAPPAATSAAAPQEAGPPSPAAQPGKSGRADGAPLSEREAREPEAEYRYDHGLPARDSLDQSLYYEFEAGDGATNLLVRLAREDRLTSTEPSPAARRGAADTERLADLEARVTKLEEALSRLREDGSGPGPAPPAPDRARWQAAVAGAEGLQRARDMASQALPALPDSRAWQRTGDLARSARRLANDASSGQLRFSNPGHARRAWHAVWAEACEITGDLAGGLMNRLRPGSRGWNAARSLRHAAAEGVAHARGWLPRPEHLPAGSYEAPALRRPPTWVVAEAATRLHDSGASLSSQLDFPALKGAMEGVPARRAPRGRDLRRAARTARDRAQHPAPGRR